MKNLVKSSLLILIVSLLVFVSACDECEEDCDCSDDEDNDDDTDDDAGDDDTENPQVEFTEPIPLLNDDGSLLAQGWARRPYMMYNPIHVPDHLVGKIKEWDAYLIITPEFMFGITVSDIRLATFIGFELIDFNTEEIISGLELQAGSLGFMPLDMYGVIDYENLDNSFYLDYNKGVRTINAHFEKSIATPQLDCQITLTQDPQEEDVAAAAPFLPPGTFFYENKIVGMVASGQVTVDDKTYYFNPEDAFTVLDWGRGILPHINEWHWGVATGRQDGGIIGLNIGDGWNDNTLGTANALKIHGKLSKLYNVYFEYDYNQMLLPWHIYSDDGKFEATLEPFFYQKTGMIIFDVGMMVDKVYGHFSGTMTKDDGTEFEFENLLGFVEQSSQRW